MATRKMAGKILVIVESPAKARTIAGFLGGDYVYIDLSDQPGGMQTAMPKLLKAMELPAYQLPSLRHVAARVGDSGWSFLRQAGHDWPIRADQRGAYRSGRPDHRR